MLSRIALLALLSTSVACKKQQRIITRGAKAKTATEATSKATDKVILKEDKKVPLDSEQNSEALENLIFDLAELFNPDDLIVIREEMVKQAEEELLTTVNEARTADSQEPLTLEAILDSGDYSELATDISLSIDPRTGEVLKDKIQEVLEGSDCTDCMINPESLVISVNHRGEVLITDFSLDEGFADSESSLKTNTLPALSGTDETNENKANLIAHLHFGKLSFDDSDENQEPREKVEPLEIEAMPLAEIKTEGPTAEVLPIQNKREEVKVIGYKTMPLTELKTEGPTAEALPIQNKKEEAKAVEIKTMPVVELKTTGPVAGEIKLKKIETREKVQAIETKTMPVTELKTTGPVAGEIKIIKVKKAEPTQTETEEDSDDDSSDLALATDPD